MAKVQPLVAIFSAVDQLSAPVRKMREAIDKAKESLDKTETKAFNLALQEAKRSFGQFTDTLKSGAQIAGTALVAGFAASVAVAYDAIGAFDEMGSSIDDVSNRLGVGAEALQQWRWAAQRTGSSPEAMDKALQKLNQTMQNVANGSGKDAAELFKRLNISIKNSDGTLKSATDVMGELSKAFEVNENGALRTSMAMTLLGKSGTELIPLLAGGTAEFEKYQKEMTDYGLLLTEQEIALAGATGDHFDRMGRSAEILKAKVGGALAPAFMTLSDSVARAFGAVANNQELLRRVSDAFAKVSNEIAAINWSAVIQSVMDFTASIFKAIDAVGGLKNIAIAIGAYLGFTKVLLPLINAVMALSNAFTILKIGLIAIKPVIMSLIGSTGIGLIFIALGALAMWIYNNWDLVKEWLKAAYDYCKPVISAIVGAFEWLIDGIVGIFNNLSSAASNVWNGLTGFIEYFINGSINNFNLLKEGVLSIFDFVKDGIKNRIEDIKDLFLTLKDAIVSAFTEAFNIIAGIFNTVMGAFSSISDFISKIGDYASNATSSAIEGIKSWWNNDTPKLEAAPMIQSQTVNSSATLDVNVRSDKGLTTDVFKTQSDGLTLNTNQGVLR